GRQRDPPAGGGGVGPRGAGRWPRRSRLVTTRCPMKSYTAADLHALARGRPIDSEVFQAIFADAEAVADLARLLQARDLLEAAEPEAVVAPADMDVTLDELTRYAERRPPHPRRGAGGAGCPGRPLPAA